MKTTVNSGRRGFLRKAGAALAAPLAAGAASASPRLPDERDTSQARLARLEDVDAIRQLTRRYVRHVNAGEHREAAALFARPPNADTRTGPTTLATDPLGGEDTIDIAANGATATARLHCSAEMETPIEPMTPLVEMARAQGGGVMKRSERGVLEGAYVKLGGCWKIERISFRVS